MSAASVYKSIPWQVQVIALAVGVGLYYGYKLLRKIESVPGAVGEAISNIPTAVSNTVAKTADEWERVAINMALGRIPLNQWNVAPLWVQAKAAALKAAILLQGYVVTADGSVLGNPIPAGPELVPPTQQQEILQGESTSPFQHGA